MVCNGIEIAGRRCGCQAGLCIPMAGEESEKYVEALKASGYTEAFSEEEAVSSGIMPEISLEPLHEANPGKRQFKKCLLRLNPI